MILILVKLIPRAISRDEKRLEEGRDMRLRAKGHAGGRGHGERI